MSSLIHIAEIAALLAVAYVVGWAVGYVVHRLVTRPATAAEAAISPERLAAVMGEAPDALVKAPVIVPVASDPPPAPPAPIPEAPLVAEAAIQPLEPVAVAEVPTVIPVPAREPALPPVTIAPVVTPPDLFARPEPIEIPATAAAPEPAPVAPTEPAAPPVILEPEPQPLTAVEPPPAPVVEPEPEPEPEPVIVVPPPPKPVPAVPFTAAPALRPGEAWSGEIKGRVPSPFEHVAPPASEPVAELPAERAVEPQPAEPAPIAEVTVAAEPTVVPPPPAPDYDEDAAMRAIEGGWSRVKARAMPNAPELHDVGAAVAAATAAVEQVLANAGTATPAPSTGKPKGLIRPRSTGKDDLKQINGLGGLDESTLNNLGVYHFDQIAAWSDAEVLWMENHVFARGRIGHENWQAQARELAATVGS